MKKLSTENLTFSKRGWQIGRLFESRGLWFGTAHYGFSLTKPTPDFEFFVQGLASREEAIKELTKLVHKEIKKGKWKEIAHG